MSSSVNGIRKVSITEDAEKVTPKERKIRHDSQSTITVPDGGWGWLVCATSCLTNGTVFGVMNTFGALYKGIEEEYVTNTHDSSSKTALVGSIATGLIFGLSPFVSLITDRFGIRPTAFVGGLLAFIGVLASSFVHRIELLYITYGVIFGIGGSLVYSPSLIILGHYFKRHLGLANGIVTLGSGLFTIGLPFVLRHCLQTIGVRHTLQFIAGLMGLLMIYSLAWKPTFEYRHDELTQFLSKESLSGAVIGCRRFCFKFFNFKIWRSRHFVIWVLVTPAALFGYFIPFFHLINYLSHAHPSYDGHVMIMCLGGSSAASRLITGKLADLPCISRLLMQQFAFVILGIATAIIPLVGNYPGLIIIALIMGLCDGCFICLLGPIAYDLVGPTGASQAMGFLLGLCSIPLTVGPPMAGLIFDKIGSYNLAFYLAGIPPILGAILLFLLPRRPQSRHAMTVAEEVQIWSSMNLAGNDAIEMKSVITSKLDLHDSELSQSLKG